MPCRPLDLASSTQGPLLVPRPFCRFPFDMPPSMARRGPHLRPPKGPPFTNRFYEKEEHPILPPTLAEIDRSFALPRLALNARLEKKISPPGQLGQGGEPAYSTPSRPPVLLSIAPCNTNLSQPALRGDCSGGPKNGRDEMCWGGQRLNQRNREVCQQEGGVLRPGYN